MFLTPIYFLNHTWQHWIFFLLGPLSLFIFIYAIFEKNNKKKYLYYSFSVLLFILFIFQSHSTHKIQLHWYQNKKFTPEQISSLMVKIIQKEQKPIILYFYANWCHSCEELENKLMRKEIAKLISEGWILIKVDVSEWNRYEDFILKQWGVYGVPALAFIDNTGKFIEPFTMIGSEPPSGTLISILRQFGNFENPI